MASKTTKTLHKCGCEICMLHPYGRIAQEHKAINRVLMGLDERNKRRFVGVLASQEGNVSQLSQITGLSRNTFIEGRVKWNIRGKIQFQGYGDQEQGACRLKKTARNREGIRKAVARCDSGRSNHRIEMDT